MVLQPVIRRRFRGHNGLDEIERSPPWTSSFSRLTA
jgi:hypothetical protein